MIISDAPNCGIITYDRNWQHYLMLGSSITIISSFIIQANVITIVNYDRKTFIVQATDENFFVIDSIIIFSHTNTKKVWKIENEKRHRGEVIHNMFYGDLKIIFLGTLS